MDPLSVAASVAGLVAAATKIARSLYTFTASVDDAPRLARNVKCEIEALSVIFSQLNGFLSNTTHAKRSRMSMTTVHQFITLITHCVLTFAELEEELDGIELGTDLVQKGADSEGTAGGMRWWDRIKWTARQDVLKEILVDLQQQKLSLNLMIGIWTCKTNQEAVKSYEQLCQAMMTVGAREQPRGRRLSIARRDTFVEKESYPRRLSRLRRSFSMDSHRRSSVLSVVSLDQVSDINSLALPIYSSELYNGAKYTAVESPQNTRVRPKSVMVMFSWTGAGAFGAKTRSPRPKSLVRRMASLLSGSSRSPSPAEFVISDPFDAKHNTHIGVDPSTGKMTIVGEESAETQEARKVGWMT